jgi:hypothetical protein
MNWDAERTGQMNWNTVLSDLCTRFEDAGSMLQNVGLISASLRAFARDIERLPELMLECGVDDAIVDQRRGPIKSMSRMLAEVEAP